MGSDSPITTQSTTGPAPAWAAYEPSKKPSGLGRSRAMLFPGFRPIEIELASWARSWWTIAVAGMTDKYLADMQMGSGFGGRAVQWNSGDCIFFWNFSRNFGIHARVRAWYCMFLMHRRWCLSVSSLRIYGRARVSMECVGCVSPSCTW
jgi:hypothetical protein